MPATPAVANICHELEGRLRLRIAEKRRDANYFASLAETMGAWPEVDSVQVNPTTASILLEHTADGDAISARARRDGLFEVRTDDETYQDPYEQIQANLIAFDQRLDGLTDGALDARGLAFTTLMAIGVIELIKGNVAAPAVSMFWYAMAALLLIQGKPGPA